MSAQDRIVTLDDVEVAYVEADGGPAGARAAFDRLESHLPSMRGRRFYGVCSERAGWYRACVAVRPEDTPVSLPLTRWTLPGGVYLRRRLDGWTERVEQIGPSFDAMAESASPDPTRPTIEHYRSRETLLLYLPVTTGR